jgi:hypothetical protein
MAARRLIQALVFLHYAAWSGATVLTPPEIPEQPFARTIYEWGDQIAVITEKYDLAERTPIFELYVVDQATLRVSPVRVPGCDTYYDIAYGGGPGRLLLCGDGKSARVYGMSGPSWTPVSGPMRGTEFRFALDGDQIAVVSESSVFLMSATSGSQPAIIPHRMEFSPHEFPSAMLLANNALLMALDVGEFGGGLYRMDLTRPGKAPERLIRGNVQALARTKSGAIWAAGGLSHLGSVSAALYRISGDRLEVVAVIGGFRGGPRFEGPPQADRITEKAGVPFPGLTSLSGLSLGADERPTVVLPTLGVFELAGDRFVRLYEGSLGFSYQVNPKTDSWAGSWPVGLAIGKTGEIYVASRSLGIFALRRVGKQYSLKQLLFDDAAHHQAPSLPR